MSLDFNLLMNNLLYIIRKYQDGIVGKGATHHAQRPALSGALVVKGEKQFSPVLSLPSMCMPWHLCMHAHMHTCYSVFSKITFKITMWHTETKDKYAPFTLEPSISKENSHLNR